MTHEGLNQSATRALDFDHGARREMETHELLRATGAYPESQHRGRGFVVDAPVHELGLCVVLDHSR